MPAPYHPPDTFEMDFCSSNERPCESPFEPTPNGCCADGRRCDEVCIAVVASQECAQAYHALADHSDQRGSRVPEETADSCCQPEQSVSDEKTAHSKQGSCCRDEQETCASQRTLRHCNDDSKASRLDSCMSTTIAKESCCGSKTGLGPVNDQGTKPATFGCCSDVTKGKNKPLGAYCDTKDNVSVTSTGSSQHRTDDDDFVQGCSFHLEEAMKKYKAYLEAGLCICRSALKQIDVCCRETGRAAVSKKRKTPPTTTSCCASKDDTDKSRRPANRQAEGGKICCSSAKKPVTKATKSCTTFRSGCCSGPKDGQSANDRSDPSCDADVHDNVISAKPPGNSDVAGSMQDIEQKAAREHVTFSITGMTCTSCVKKVLGVLANVHGIDNAKVNFVAGTGNFDVDTAKISAPAALHRLQKETGFKCSRLVSEHQTLDLNMTSTVAQDFAADLPRGVEFIEKAGKGAYRVSYDPQFIGARTILAASGGSIAPPSNDSSVSQGRRRVLLTLLSFAGAAIFTVPVCVLAFSSLPVPFLTKGIIEFVLATFVQLIAVPEFYIPALKAMIYSKAVEMDMLVVISITAAYGYSIVAFGLESSGVDLEQGTLFETSTLLITLVLLGRLVASYAKVRAVQAVSLRSLQAETAMLEDIEGKTTEIDARLLEFHDIIRIPAHSKIVSDGVIIDGESAVDESMLTGESLPVHKVSGDLVTAGTLNGSGVLRVKLTRLPGKNSITDIADLVQNALNAKPRIQDIADVVAGYFVPVVVSVAIIVFAIWIAIALRVRRQSAGGAIGTAITYSIAVLAISCPCAIGLAVPMVLVISGGVATKNGVIIKQADALERGFKVTDIIFDKTGTLTTGQLEVVQQVVEDNTLPTEQVLAIAYALVKDDAHPVAQAVAAKLKSQDISVEAVTEIDSIPGCGVQATWKGQHAKAGNPYWLGIDTSAPVTTLQEAGYTLLCVTVSQQLLVSFGLEAVIRPEALAVISALRDRSLTCHVVSGDQPTSVSNVASSLGISASNFVSRQSPADKQSYIENLKSAGKTTLFVGDGTNDAVAIAAADVGVQIGAASDVTRATADVVLLGGLEGVITILEVSKQSFNRIVFNFIWSGIYNMFAILLASGAFVKVRIAPNYAGLGEIVSVLPVILAALTMLKVNIKVL